MGRSSIIWLAMEWIYEHTKELGLTALYTLCLMTLFAILKKRVELRRHQAERTRNITDDTQHSPASIRKLSRFESSVDHLHKYGGSIASYVLVVKSKEYLNPTLVKSTLVYLTKKHEILRTKISRTKIRIQGKKKIEKKLEEMENPDFAEFHLKLKATTSDQWLTVFERELMKQFPEEGPLWRFVMLKEQFDPKEGTYSHSFVFSAHYLICDFGSGFVFFKDFVDFLSSQIQDGKSQDIGTVLQVRSSLPELLKNHIHMSQPAILCTVAKLFLNRMIERVKPKPKFKNPFTSLYPPAIIDNPLLVRKTCFIPRYLNNEETTKLIKMCKANKCTVHGAFSAIATISMATILQRGGSSAPLKVMSSFNVDLRKDCEPIIGPGELGCYSIDCHVNVPCNFATLPISTCSPQFWEFARQCDLILHQAIESGSHLYSLKLMETLHINTTKNRGDLAQDKNAAGRSHSLFHISNLGKKSMLESNSELSIEGFYFALAEHNIGPVFSNNITTINGALYWGFTYFTNVMTEGLALQYVNLVMSSLKGQCEG